MFMQKPKRENRSLFFLVSFFTVTFFFAGCNLQKNTNTSFSLGSKESTVVNTSTPTNTTSTSNVNDDSLAQVINEEQDQTTWKTFKSKQMDYTIQHPKDWDTWSGSDFYTDLQERSTDIEYLSRLPRAEFSNNTNNKLTFVIELTPKNDRTFEDIIAEKSKFSNVSDVRALVIQGKPAVQQVEEDPRDPEYEYGYRAAMYVDGGKDVYAINVNVFSPETYVQQKELIDAVLQTFTVLE